MRKTLGLVVFVGAALATETRVASMGGIYQFILDDEALVIQDNPAYIARFNNLSVTEMNTQSNLQYGKAYGGILAEQGPVAIGLYLNNPLYTFPTLDGSRDAHGLTLALGSGKGFGWGLRIGYAAHREGDTAFTIRGERYAFSPGLIVPLGRGHLSVFGQVQLSSYSDNSAGPDSVLEPLSRFSSAGFGLRYAGSGDIRLIAGSGIYRSDNGKRKGDSSAADVATGASLFVGVNGNTFETGLVVAGITLDGYRRRGNGDKSLEEIRALASLGSEINIGSWFVFRSNMSKFLFIYRAERMADPDNPYTFIGSSGFVGSFGMGLLFGPARLDATLSEDILYHGPYFLTGNESNFAMKLAFLYRFGRDM